MIAAMVAWLKSKKNIRRIGRWLGWISLLLLLFTLLTGYGITEFRIVDTLTLGLLNKASAHQLHHYTDVPLLVLILTHVGIALWVRWPIFRKKRSDR